MQTHTFPLDLDAEQYLILFPAATETVIAVQSGKRVAI